MTIKTEAHSIIDSMPDDSTWDDLVKELYKHKKITLGLTDLEVVQHELNEADLNAIMARLRSSSNKPDDMRNTKTYNPGNAVTLGMIAGVFAIVFSFVFPPIAWVGAIVAFFSGAFGIVSKEEKSWIPVLLAVVSLVPLFVLVH